VSFIFPKAFIFDWDNTLVESWPVIMQAINSARAKFGLPVWTYDEILLNCTRAARDSFPDWFGANWKDAYDYYYATFDELRRNGEITTRPGALELLDWLKSQNTPCFIVSNKRGDFLRHEVQRLGWESYFKAVVGAQDAPRDKPAREHVDFALQGTTIIPDENVWFAGDSEADIACARNAGCRPILIGEQKLAEKLNVVLFFKNCTTLHSLLYNHSK